MTKEMTKEEMKVVDKYLKMHETGEINGMQFLVLMLKLKEAK